MRRLPTIKGAIALAAIVALVVAAGLNANQRFFDVGLNASVNLVVSGDAIQIFSGDGVTPVNSGDSLDFGTAAVDFFGRGPTPVRGPFIIKNVSNGSVRVIVTGDMRDGIVPLFGTSQTDLKPAPDNAFTLATPSDTGDHTMGYLGLKFGDLKVGQKSTTIIFRATDSQGTPIAATKCSPQPIGGPLGWTKRAPHPTGVEGAAGIVIGNSLYVTHGYNPSSGDNASAFVYDISKNTWAPIASAQVIRSELVGVCFVEDGKAKVFAIAGRTGSGDAVEAYDPGTNTWSSRPSVPTPRGGLGAAWDPATNTIYVFGGRPNGSPHSGTPLAVNEAYDVMNRTWSRKAPLPVPTMGIYSTVYYSGKIYVIGGFDGTAVRNLVQIYDPATDSWSAGAPMPTPRSNLVAGICGQYIYAIGGYNGSSNLATNEAYDPVSDKWIAGQPPLPGPRSELAAAVTFTGADIFATGTGIFGAAGSPNDVFTCQGGPTGGTAQASAAEPAGSSQGYPQTTR